LGVVQGHPKLLELADAEATDPQRLSERLAEANRVVPGHGGRLEAFFARGKSQLAPEQFLDVLAGWTRGVARTLAEGPRTLFWLLCALEEADRWQPIVKANWADVWRRLGRPGKAPALEEALGPLVARALVQVEQQRVDAPVRYRVHPAVTEAARQAAGEGFQAAVDTQLAAYWQAIYQQAREAEGGEATSWVVRASRSAAPYLLRRKDWETAGRLLEHALRRDRSPATTQAILPLLSQIADATEGTDLELSAAGILASALTELRPEEAERQLQRMLRQAVTEQRFDLAAAAAYPLVDLLRGSGRLAEALELAEQMEDYILRAGLGRWTQLGSRARGGCYCCT
jgi:hypothetical protein